jgi:hypothetical protein
MTLGRKTGGRQKGTPNRATRDIRELAQEFGPGAVERLAQLAGLVPGQPGADTAAAQIAACNAILNRAYGLPTQPIEAEDAEPFTVLHLVAAREISAHLKQVLEARNGTAPPPVIESDAETNEPIDFLRPALE